VVPDSIRQCNQCRPTFIIHNGAANRISHGRLLITENSRSIQFDSASGINAEPIAVVDTQTAHTTTI
jgi:hypothetical protein